IPAPGFALPFCGNSCIIPGGVSLVFRRRLSTGRGGYEAILSIVLFVYVLVGRENAVISAKAFWGVLESNDNR
ncbi:MAG: hypothetical protein J6M27_08820, partial [Lachnospiraceae bacterium]|nr:hypothetical protein [Lachnospiraceae bacterium]